MLGFFSYTLQDYSRMVENILNLSVRTLLFALPAILDIGDSVLVVELNKLFRNTTR